MKKKKLELDFIAKLGGDLSWFTQHLKSNWMGNGPLLFHTMVEVKPHSYSLRHKNKVNIKIKASYEQRIFVHETLLK